MTASSLNRTSGDIRVLASGLRFPEGPVWMEDGSIALVEIARGTVTRVSPTGAVDIIATPGGGPNGLAVGPDGAFYVCNNGGFTWREENGAFRPIGPSPDYVSGRIDLVDPVSGESRTLYGRCGDHHLCGPNDLVFDAHGGFYFTDTGRVHPRARDHGGVYYAQSDGSEIIEIIHPMIGPNGIGLSPDGNTLYVAEMETARLWAYEILSPGRLAKEPFPVLNGGQIVVGLGGFQRIDSLAVEASGNICLAALVTGEIITVSPQGEIVRTVRMPEIYCTNLCFGGPGRRTAFVTMGLSGQLLAMPWPKPGLRLAYGA